LQKWIGAVPSRRSFLAMTAAAPLALPARGATRPVRLVAAERPATLPGRSGTSPLWTYGGDWPLALSVRRGEAFEAVLENRLADHTSIHWHGVRVPFAMDGVPHVTQKPVEPGQDFTYRFSPPDPGTFFFHPHCDTMQALSRGLAGVLIVEDPREEGLFDADHLLVLKDWRVRPDGGFEPFSTDAGAARAGTFGGLRTVNGAAAPALKAPPGARIRLRVVNIDPTRVPVLELAGAEGRVIATDGNACAPFPVQGWALGPAMRAEIAFIQPARPGAEVVLRDVWGQEAFPLARIITEGAARGADRRPLRLPEAELPEPQLKGAPVIEMSLLTGHADPKLEAWMKETGMSLDALCLSERIFWSINRRAWPGMSHEHLPPPLAELKSGRSYVIEMLNGTPHRHPMHLHGHTFKVLGSNQRRLPPHWADTVLVEPKERLRIAFVAGEPGDWMFHCHIIEHQETGMMGYFRVS